MSEFIEYNTVPKADSGIYLRGSPQVQIWDINLPSRPDDTRDKPRIVRILRMMQEKIVAA